MRAISLWQPWASLVVAGVKRYETRHWETRYRGPIVIHAAKKWDGELRSVTSQFWQKWPDALRNRVPQEPPLGCLVGTAVLADCYVMNREDDGRGTYITLNGKRGDLVDDRELAFGNWETGRFAWRLQNIRRFAEPIPFRGAQGFFDVPDDLVAKAASYPEAQTR